MNNWLFITVLVVLASIWHWFHNVKHHSIRKARVQVKREPQRFHGVSIRPCRRSCSRAQELRHQRFLSAETPNLPLEGCTKPNCTCSYAHHKDRRHMDERRFRNSVRQQERRIKSERRHHTYA